VVLIGGPIHRHDVPVVADQVHELLEGTGSRRLICDVSALEAPDAATVDAICRLKLMAGRLGCRLWLRAASPELVELLDLVGLGGVVPLQVPSALGSKRETEQRKHLRGVEEECDPADPAI
jgi:anti-anti-sigma regulatory factor